MRVAAPFTFDDRLGEALAARLSAQRRGALVFALLTLALTPMFVAVVALVLVLVGVFVASSIGEEPQLGVAPIRALVLVFLLMLFGMSAAAVRRYDTRRGRLPWRPVALAAVLWLAMAALGLATPLPLTMPFVFWPAFALLGLAVVAALLRIYSPAESYYFGWLAGGMDDPFTFRDDVDRQHVAFGFVGAVVGAAVDAYEQVLRSAWLAHPARAHELAAAAPLLARLTRAAGPVSAAALAADSPAEAARALRLLERLGLVRLARDGLRLADDGLALVAGCRLGR